VAVGKAERPAHALLHRIGTGAFSTGQVRQGRLGLSHGLNSHQASVRDTRFSGACRKRCLLQRTKGLQCCSKGAKSFQQRRLGALLDVSSLNLAALLERRHLFRFGVRRQ